MTTVYWCCSIAAKLYSLYISNCKRSGLWAQGIPKVCRGFATRGDWKEETGLLKWVPIQQGCDGFIWSFLLTFLSMVGFSVHHTLCLFSNFHQNRPVTKMRETWNSEKQYHLTDGKQGKPNVTDYDMGTRWKRDPLELPRACSFLWLQRRVTVVTRGRGRVDGRRRHSRTTASEGWWP